MPVELEWRKTVIGGDTLAYDFVASYHDITVGRIMREEQGPQRGKWAYSFQLGSDVRFFSGDMNGTEDTKQEAADKIKFWMQQYLDTEPEKGGGKGLPPEEMPPDQRSMQLRHLKVRDPETYQELLQQLRTGAVKR